MNRHNARLNAFAVGQLQLAPSDRVLEIGFGGGSTLPALLNTAAFVAGVDRSYDVIGWAKRHFAKAIGPDARSSVRAMSNRCHSTKRRLTGFALSTRSISGRHWKLALPRFTASSNREAGLLLDFCPRRKWTAWACRVIFSRRARLAMSSSRCGKPASTTSGSSVQHRRLPGTFSSRRADHALARSS